MRYFPQEGDGMVESIQTAVDAYAVEQKEIFALKGKGLTTVAVASCVAVFLVELIRF